MDMNDILNQWDSMQKEKNRKQKESGKNQVSHKKANAPTKEEKALAEEKDFNKRLEKQINEKYYTPKELQYDNEVNIHFSPFEFQTFLSLKEELCDKGNKIFTILPLKTFGKKQQGL